MEIHSNWILYTNLKASLIFRVIDVGKLYPSKNMSSVLVSFFCSEIYLIWVIGKNNECLCWIWDTSSQKRSIWKFVIVGYLLAKLFQGRINKRRKTTEIWGVFLLNGKAGRLLPTSLFSIALYWYYTMLPGKVKLSYPCYYRAMIYNVNVLIIVATGCNEWNPFTALTTREIWQWNIGETNAERKWYWHNEHFKWKNKIPAVS